MRKLRENFHKSIFESSQRKSYLCLLFCKFVYVRAYDHTFYIFSFLTHFTKWEWKFSWSRERQKKWVFTEYWELSMISVHVCFIFVMLPLLYLTSYFYIIYEENFKFEKWPSSTCSSWIIFLKGHFEAIFEIIFLNYE